MLSRTNLQRLISYHHRRLQKLKEKRAAYGVNIDPGVLIEIEDIEDKIIKLSEDLKSINDSQSTPDVEVIASEVGLDDLTWPRQAFPSLPRNPSMKYLRQWLLRK